MVECQTRQFCDHALLAAVLVAKNQDGDPYSKLEASKSNPCTPALTLNMNKKKEKMKRKRTKALVL